MNMSLPQKLAAEALGTAFLLIAIVGSGIAGAALAGPNAALALLANAIATGCALFAIIAAFGPISGAHFNPLVTLCDAVAGGLPWRNVMPYVLAQIAGALAGVAIANVMFGLPAFFASTHARTGGAQWFSEFIATFGLLSVIWGTARSHARLVPFAVGAYITGAYWFASSTSFANPAVTLARSMTQTFSGIRAHDILPFVGAQIAGALCATLLFGWLLPPRPNELDPILVPHQR